EIAYRTASACLLASNTGANIEALVKLADRSLAGMDQRHGSYRAYQLVKFLAEYRAGRYDSAAKGLRDLSPDASGVYFAAACFAALAMAEHRRGQAAEAHAALDSCLTILKERSPEPAKGRSFPGNWYDWLHGWILYREADEMINQASGAKN